jgi:murein L,D-transpeptidase YcbB/YkuD
VADGSVVTDPGPHAESTPALTSPRAAPSRAPQPALAGLQRSLASSLDQALAGTARAPVSPSTGERAALESLYARRVALWLADDGRPLARAREALELLAGSTSHGLDAGAYHLPELAGLAASLDASPRAAEAATFDLALSTAILRYLRHLHTGRLEPRSVGFRLGSRADEHDYGELLRAALEGEGVAALAGALAPELPLYARLRVALPRYRELAADTSVEAPVASAVSVRPGDSCSELALLHRLLVAVGDLAAATPPPPAGEPYGEPWLSAVQRFQARHGLAVDGVIGRETFAALRVPLAWRARQIELSLERLRWLPHLQHQRLVAVNVPMFRLAAWDVFPGEGSPALTTEVIVGRALRTQTPVFADQMRYLIFRPYWNVPASIVRGEILPAVARDASYLARHDMEIVAGGGDDARPLAASAENLARLRQGVLRLRQRPGPRNALGLVKFVFPNDSSVYLHDTPTPQLFARSRRDFSHGCVRVADPTALAEWALAGQSGWDREAILAAMHAGTDNRRVDLERPVEVLLYYLTALVEADGTVHFAPDLYGHDQRLDAALRRPRPP